MSIERARQIAADTIGVKGSLRQDYLNGIFDDGDHVRIAFAALAPPPAAVRPDGEREAIARIIALHGLGSTSGARRAPPNDTWTIAEWHRRILECVPERVEADCYDLADAILAALPQRGESEADVIERCAAICLEVSALIGAKHGSSIDSALRQAADAIRAGGPWS